MVDYGKPGRPIHRRLHAAMGVSTLFIAAIFALLELLFDFYAVNSIPGPEQGHFLTVLVNTGGGEPVSELPVKQQPALSPSQDAPPAAGPVDRQQEVATPASPEPPADSQPVKDWHAIADAIARASVGDYSRSEESRASMWRETRSIMFEPAGEFVVKEEQPVISDVRFIPRIHVVGLGVTIGSCFIGIPIVGVPVEQRSLAINLFVCARDSG